jgi:A/G-specific adenine glycosylase
MDVPRLLAWYAAERRRLPWREEVAPYRTLVSELMLQQTRVDTVIPYFDRWMSRFPTVEDLAAAPLDDVLAAWAGLGYYRRARNLHAAARAVAGAGAFPATVEGLLALPGVGPYTAGAIASIALGLDAPAVDGNVERVLARLRAVERPAKAWLWAEASASLPKGQAGDYNQALMELGATVCTPRAPNCPRCPLREGCRGRTSPERFPEKAERRPIPSRRVVAAVAWREGRVLLARRPDEGLLAGLWEPPWGAGPVATMLDRTVGLSVRESAPMSRVEHVFTHLHLVVDVYVVDAEGEPTVGPEYAIARWLPPDALDAVGLSTLARKLLAAAAVPPAPSLTRTPRS